MDEDSRALLDEQQRLLTEINEDIKSAGAATVFSAAISIMNLIEGVMAGRPREQIITTNPDVALSQTVKFLNRLGTGDERTLSIAERLTAKELQSARATLGTKVARVLVLGNFLGFKFATPEFATPEERIHGMIADSSARKFWSDLQKSVEKEFTGPKQA